MSNEIKVKVTAHAGRKFLIMYYDDPLSGRRHERSTKQTRRREAEREAAKWESQLREGRYSKPMKTTWEDFRQYFYEEHLLKAPKKTRTSYETALNVVEKHIKITRLAEFNRERIQHLADAMKASELSIESVRSYLGHLRGALNWAHKRGMLNAVPVFDMGKRDSGSKLSKGRAITTEEFERMLGKVEAGIIAAAQREPKENQTRPRSPAVLEKYRQAIAKRAADTAPAFTRLLHGLWLSGLRLGEALVLSWDDSAKIEVDFSGRRPMLRIPAKHQKAKRDTLLPMSPEFAEFLAVTPHEQRTGPVFALPVIGLNTVSKVISAIGEVAGVVVDKEGEKFASAHDLRRAFGFRWSSRVMPAVLKELMRHTDIGTTMRYYVTQNAEQTADVIWEAVGKQSRKVGTFVGSNEKSPVEHIEGA